MSNTTLTEDAWVKLFDKYNILEQIASNGFFRITTAQIKEFREPRLMAKFDHSKDQPPIFRNNNISILPISTREYVLAPFEAYNPFSVDDSPIIQMSLPSYLQSISLENLSGEARSLNAAFAAGIIAHFVEDEELLPTVEGRMGSGDFQFTINKTQSNTSIPISVSGAQIEIDAAYEGINYLTLFEAKNDIISEDFIIRQLYYPYRTWYNKIPKQVKLVFLRYSNNLYYLTQYIFEQIENYNSIRPIKQQRYSLSEEPINERDIRTVFNTVRLISEPEIPFPQADKFEKVVNVFEMAVKEPTNALDIADTCDFVPRQADYYYNSGVYLGLLDTKDSLVYVTDLGKKVCNLNHKAKQLKFVELILSHEIFYKVFKYYLDTGNLLPKQEIVSIMKTCNLYNVNSDSTYDRRASTVRGWIRWIIALYK